MDVIKYCRIDLSNHFNTGMEAKQAFKNHPSISVVANMDDDTIFITESYLDIMEYKAQTKLLEKDQLPSTLMCPLSGLIGVVDEGHLTWNQKRLNAMESMLDHISKVELFHKVFGHPIAQNPRALTQVERAFRCRLLKEELDEFMASESITDQFDALLDLQYILFGTVVQSGLKYHFGKGFNEVQRSNMSKLDINGKPLYREDGKILKSERYFPPNLNKVLKINDDSKD